MNIYCLYFPNGKRYVGVESKTRARISNHLCAHSLKTDRPQLVDRAVVKYGRDNIRWRYLATNCTQDVARALERFFIRLLGLRDRKAGYNLTDGGEGASGRVTKPETSAKIVAARRARNNYRPFDQSFAFRGRTSGAFKVGGTPPNKGVPCSAEQRAKISAAKRGKPQTHNCGFQNGSMPWNVGVPISPDSKAKMIATKLRNSLTVSA